MKYNVGDIVRIKTENDVAPEWRGKVVKIIRIEGNLYEVEDGAYLMEDCIECCINTTFNIVHPSHYQGKIEPIDLIESQGLSFNRGNIIKYVCRAGKKDDELADLKKAEYYLKREIERLERK